MITLRTSPFDLLDRLEQQVSQAERVPAAEVIETNASYTVRLELPGVDHDSIDVKATDRSLVISAERQPSISAEDNTSPNRAQTQTQTQMRSNCSASSGRERGVAVFASPSHSIATNWKPPIATAFLRSGRQKATTAPPCL